VRQLKLKKETVRLLSDESLMFAVGGTSSSSIDTGGVCVSSGCPPQTMPGHCVWPKQID